MSAEHMKRAGGGTVCGRAQSAKPTTRGCRDCAARLAGEGRYRVRAEARAKAVAFAAKAKKLSWGGKQLRNALRALVGPAKSAAPSRSVLIEELREAGIRSRDLPDYRQLALGGG